MKLTLVGWIFNGQNQHCKNIEQRHAAEHHKRSHTGSAIDILDEGYAKDCCAASVTGLHEFTGQTFITQENTCQNPDDDDGNGSGSETEQNEFSVRSMDVISQNSMAGSPTRKTSLSATEQNSFVRNFFCPSTYPMIITIKIGSVEFRLKIRLLICNASVAGR